MYIAVTENLFILSWIDKERLSMLETLIDHFQGLFLSLSLSYPTNGFGPLSLIFHLCSWGWPFWIMSTI